MSNYPLFSYISYKTAVKYAILINKYGELRAYHMRNLWEAESSNYKFPRLKTSGGRRKYGLECKRANKRSARRWGNQARRFKHENKMGIASL